MHKRLTPLWQRFDRTLSNGHKTRLQICNRIAFAVQCLHAWDKYIIADLKPQNILINRQGKISITDVDSFQIYSTKEIKYKGDAATPEYLPAEYHLPDESNQTPTINWDKFAMAVSFYQILFGIHPYSATAKDVLETSMIHENISNDLFVHGVNKVHLKIVPPPHEKYLSLPTSIQALFIRAFDKAAPTNRPTAEEWTKVLRDELT
jgi:DNA-binding helix-hairpin-helix protein with protein kinase domain